MQCKVCGRDNPSEASFCASCGAALVDSTEPSLKVEAPEVAVEYAGVLIRFAAWIVDFLVLLLLLIIIIALPIRPVGVNSLLLFILLFLLYHWLLIGFRGQTLGKTLFRIKVVDVQGNKPGMAQAFARELLKGFSSPFYMNRDKQKRGWHDKAAKTWVVKVVKAV